MGHAFLCYFLCDFPWCASTFSQVRPGRTAKGELATCRHRADSGREPVKMYAAIAYTGSMRE